MIKTQMTVMMDGMVMMMMTGLMLHRLLVPAAMARCTLGQQRWK